MFGELLNLAVIYLSNKLFLFQLHKISEVCGCRVASTDACCLKWLHTLYAPLLWTSPQETTACGSEMVAVC